MKLLTMTLASLALFPLWAQTPAASGKPEFDVASIKELPPAREQGQDLSFVGTSGERFKIAGNRVMIRGPLRSLISAAYGVMDYQVTGGPAWSDSVIYVVTAKTPGAAVPTQEQVRPMFQALLADRFQLKVHHDTKEIPVFHLTISKPSPDFKPAAADENFAWNITQEADNNLRSKATKESIADFVQLVGASTDRPVIDKTGVKGFIDYQIVFSEEGTQNRDDVNVRILDAIKKQLGMKLEPAKDQIDVLVVDRAEKASEN